MTRQHIALARYLRSRRVWRNAQPIVFPPCTVARSEACLPVGGGMVPIGAIGSARLPHGSLTVTLA